MSCRASIPCELPDDVLTLKTIISGKDAVIAELQKRVEFLKEQVTVLQKYRFARSSEKWTEEDRLQLWIFDEAESWLARSGGSEPAEIEQITYARRKSKGRKPIDDSLPRTIILHELSHDERRCGLESCPQFGSCTKLRPQIGEQIREELEFIPAKIIVNRHVYRSYGPIDCLHMREDETQAQVISAPRELRLVPRSIATASLLSFIVVSKFADALPYYRLERILERIGVHVSRQTMSCWVVTVARACWRYLELLYRKIREGPLINMDETRLQVLCEPNRSPSTDSYMWVLAGSDGGSRRVVMYFYAQTRSAEVAEKLLEGYAGVVQSDGYGVYHRVAKRNAGIYDVGCMAHVRRKFYEAYIAAGKKGEALKGLKYIRDIYAIERNLRTKGLTDNEFVRERRRQVAPVVRSFRKWLLTMSKSVPPSTLLGQATSYAIGEYRRLVRYLKYAFVTPDNNAAERAIRPFVVGRKNWLFNNTPLGAHASAGMYSIVETARANRLDPFHFVWKLFRELPQADTEEKLEQLLPWNMEGIPPYRLDKKTREN